MSTCQCSMAISVVGDGCRYCQPQTYIEHLLETLEDARAAPVSEAKAQGVVMPERQVVEGAYGYDLGGNYGEGYSEGWNDCIDEFARLNGGSHD